MNAKIMKINSMRKLVYSTSDILKTAASMPSKPIIYQQAIIKTGIITVTPVGVCVCVCACVYSFVLISCTILPDVTYFSPNVTYFLIVYTMWYQEGVFA